MSEKITNVDISHLLKVDSFAQQYTVKKSYDTVGRKLVESNEDFFTFIYVKPNSSIKVNGVVYQKKYISQWFNQSVLGNDNCLLLIIEGYAGCGKSTWVQSILYNLFGNDSYEYSYYNYNVGTHPGDKKQIDPIRESLVNDIIMQMIRVLSTDDGEKSFKAFEKLTSSEYMYQLDNNTIIWNCFSGADNIRESAEYIYNSRNHQRNDSFELKFQECAAEQLNSNNFDTYRLLCVDYLWRLAQFIANPDKYRNNFYVCYDNLDAIYDNELLCLFRDNLLHFRYNLNEFIASINDAQIIDVEIPHFVIFTTYRKITEVRSDRYNTETIQDIYLNPNYVMNVEVSSIYNYKEIVKKRLQHFQKKVSSDCMFGNNRKKLEKQIKELSELLKLNLINKYSNMWNYNYRSCGNVLGIMMNHYDDEIKVCKKLVNQKRDGYNEKRSCYIGASSVFLHIMCNILGQKGIWGPEYLDLTNHNYDNNLNKTSLSRLILNYLSNNTLEATSVADIFKTFDKVFDYQYICKIMGQMLKRVSEELWRRPIYYYKNAFVNENDVTHSFLEQYKKYINHEINLVEFSICESGKIFIEKIAPHFEFYSTRLLPLCKSLYCISEGEDLKKVLESVYNQIKTCCNKQDEFRKEYMRKYNMSNKEYLNQKFHSRTNAGNLQLHIERVIFSHIGYLNDYRMYLINIKPYDTNIIDEFNDLLLRYISDYLELYETKIVFISPSRKDVANRMRGKLDVATRKENPDKYISIDVDD